VQEVSKNKLGNEEIIKLYKDFVDMFGKTPTQHELNNEYKNKRCPISVSVINKRFGGLTSLNTLCGIELNYKIYSDEEIIEMVKNYYSLFGMPRKKDLCSYYNISEKALIKRFDGFRNLLVKAGIEIPKESLGRYAKYRNITDEDALELLKNYCDENGRPTQKDFISGNGLPSFRVYVNRFGTMKNVLNIIGYEIDDTSKKYFSEFKNMSDEELLQILKDYNLNIGFPTQRVFIGSNNLPSYTIYAYKFGSFRNAIILADISIPNNRERWFDREQLSDEEMLKLLEYHTDKKLLSSDYLLTGSEINDIQSIPHISTYNTRFGTLANAYEKIGIDNDEFNSESLEKDMVLKYKQIYTDIERTPHSRDIEEYSRNKTGFYSMSTYEYHFGSIYDLQIYCDFMPTIIGKHKTRTELLDDLKDLYESLGRVPTQRDVTDCEWMASSQRYYKEFNSFTEALKVAGFKDDIQKNKCILTPQGNYCRSSYEYDFCVMLEDSDLEFWQEDYYYNYIDNYNRRHRFDFTVKYNNNIYPIEIFGIMEYEWYREKTNNKINLCKDNGIKLIDLYKEDFKKMDKDKLYKMLMIKIKDIEQKELIPYIIRDGSEDVEEAFI